MFAMRYLLILFQSLECIIFVTQIYLGCQLLTNVSFVIKIDSFHAALCCSTRIASSRIFSSKKEKEFTCVCLE